MELLAAVNGFVRGEAEHAALVTDRLRSFLWRYLASSVRDVTDREDVIAEVVARLWRRTGHLSFPTLGAFWAYAAKTARSVAMNRSRANVPVEPYDEELTGEDATFVDTVAVATQDRARLYALADELWLGLHEEPDDPNGRTRLLAAQLYFLHRRPVSEIAAVLLGTSPSGANRVAAWLEEDSVLLALCFDQLYYENDRLAAYLLNPENPPPPAYLDELARPERAVELGGWSPGQVRMLLLRYRNGLLKEKILQLLPGCKGEELQALFDRCAARMPFSRCTVQLKGAFLETGVKFEALKSPGLYRRLVFQYYAADELPHRQILERAGPVAEASGYSLTEAMLNVWLSNGRLFTQLAAHAKGRA